jgi:hypothetical protein
MAHWVEKIEQIGKIELCKLRCMRVGKRMDDDIGIGATTTVTARVACAEHAHVD